MAEAEERIIIGKITSAHGIRGEVKVSIFIDDPDFLQEVETLYLESRRGRRALPIASLRFHKNGALVRFEGIEDRNAAEALRNRELSIPLAWMPELDEGEYYVAQIVGLAVETEEGERLGEVAEVMFTGANEVYVIRDGPHGEVLLPAIESVVLAVELEAERVVVRVPEGLLPS